MHPKNNTILNTGPNTHKYRLTCDTCKHNFHSFHWQRQFRWHCD